MGELLGGFCEEFGENWPRYTASHCTLALSCGEPSITSLRYFVLNMILQTQLSPASLTLWLKVRLKFITSHAIYQSAFHNYNPIIDEVLQYGFLHSDTSYCYSVRIVFMRRRNIRDKTLIYLMNSSQQKWMFNKRHDWVSSQNLYGM